MADFKTNVPRISLATLGLIPLGTAKFSYDRRRLRPRIVHLGLGAFYRAHGALFTEDALDAHGGDWGIVGASLKRPDQRNRLTPQGCLYTTVENGPNGQKARIVGCLLNVLVGPENPASLLNQLSDRETAIVTLTVTEKGYCHDPASGRLNTDCPEIRHDIDHPDAPQSAIGLITAALGRRKAAGLSPFTIATCDNLPNNGILLAGLVQEFALSGRKQVATEHRTAEQNRGHQCHYDHGHRQQLHTSYSLDCEPRQCLRWFEGGFSTQIESD
jgi:fructuronate reductase